MICNGVILLFSSKLAEQFCWIIQVFNIFWSLLPIEKMKVDKQHELITSLDEIGQNSASEYLRLQPLTPEHINRFAGRYFTLPRAGIYNLGGVASPTYELGEILFS